MRIVEQTIRGNVTYNLQNSARRLDRLQNMLSTGKQIQCPSDDPVGLTRSLSLRTGISAIEQYIRNNEESTTFMKLTEETLSAVYDVLVRAKELALAGANEDLVQADRDNIATEVNQVLEQLSGDVCADFGGRFLFGGTMTHQAPFTFVHNPDGEIASATYRGNTGEIHREISAGITMTINVNGEEVFQSNPNELGKDVFRTLIGLRDALRAGETDAIQGVIVEALDTDMEVVNAKRAAIGAKMSQLETLNARMESEIVSRKELLSVVEDADLVEVISDLKLEETVYTTALMAGARILQVSLIDYL